MRGEKKFQVGLSWYFHTISLVAGLTSITREYGTIEYQHVAVLQQSWGMLTGDRRRAKLP
jgi:hypothetical protein